MSETAVATISPASTLTDFNGDRVALKQFLLKELKQGSDYGIIPGTGNKKVLHLAGAEKLAKYFGMRPQYECLKEIEDWEKGFVYYKYKCTLHHIKSGLIVGDSERSCNSRESNKRSKTVYDVANTCKAIAQKRAIVAAVRTATMASDLFEDDEAETEKTAVKTELSPLVARLFGVAGRRGFDADKLKEIVKTKYKVDHMEELTNDQLNAAIDGFSEHYSEVAPGQPPQKREVQEAVVVDEAQEKFVDSAMAKVQEEVEPMRDVKAELTAKIKKLKEQSKNGQHA